jgi:capsular exopolysaccharide synthesis family protein
VLIGLILGLILPGIYLFIKELLNIRITSKADIEKMSTVPVIGEISHNTEEKSLVTGVGSRSVISEQFRALRTNLQYVLDQRKSNVLLFTSSMSGEGKSFLSLNLGSALGLTGKKVVFMEMDLRKPKLSENMGLDHNHGFTNYVISGKTDYKQMIKPAWFNENCYLISAGPIPPNPAELLMSEKLDQLIEDLKKEFDYVIIDCAPIGLVTDALMLEKYADLTLYVVRQDYTYKSQLNIVNDLEYNRKVKKMYLIMNDIKTQKSGYAAYGSGSYGGYGYGGYAEEEKKKNWLKKLVDK